MTYSKTLLAMALGAVVVSSAGYAWADRDDHHKKGGFSWLWNDHDDDDDDDHRGGHDDDDDDDDDDGRQAKRNQLQDCDGNGVINDADRACSAAGGATTTPPNNGLFAQ